MWVFWNIQCSSKENGIKQELSMLFALRLLIADRDWHLNLSKKSCNGLRITTNLSPYSQKFLNFMSNSCSKMSKSIGFISLVSGQGEQNLCIHLFFQKIMIFF